VSSRTREAIGDRNRTLHELSNAQRQATLDAQQERLGVQSGSALTEALKQALISIDTQLRSTQRGLQVGACALRVDVLNAEQQLFATRKDLAATRYKTLVATLQLKATAGTFAEADLRTLDAPMQRPDRPHDPFVVGSSPTRPTNQCGDPHESVSVH
jgi:outer membrane protein